MRRSICFAILGLIATSTVLFPITSRAVFPIAALGKQFLQNIIFGGVKDQMIGSLAGLGCKGSRLAGLIASVDGGGHLGVGKMSGGMPSGMTMPRGMKLLGPGMTMPNAVGPSPDPEAQMRALMGGGGSDMAMMPPSGMSPDQAEQMQKSMAAVQEAMNHPLSRTETLAVFDEMASLGLFTNEMHGQVRDCIALAPAGSDETVGVAGAMIKATVLPALREAKRNMSNLTPAEQNELADAIVDGLKEASPKDRQNFLDGFGAGFFPAPVVEKVRTKIAKR